MQTSECLTWLEGKVWHSSMVDTGAGMADEAGDTSRKLKGKTSVLYSSVSHIRKGSVSRGYWMTSSP